jgi:hypothetical protein
MTFGIQHEIHHALAIKCSAFFFVNPLLFAALPELISSYNQIAGKIKSEELVR